MLTVFIDPSVNDPELLKVIATDLKLRMPCVIVCFFNLHQAEFFKQRMLEVRSMGEEAWSLSDRKVVVERIMQGFNDQYYKPYATVPITIDQRTYEFNVFRFLSINTFLKNLIIPVAKTLFLYIKRNTLEECLVIGSPSFYHHVTYCLQRLNYKHKAEHRLIDLNHKGNLKNNWFGTRALGKLAGILFNSLIRRKYPVVIPSGQMTEPLMGNKSLRKYTIIHSLENVVKLLSGFSSLKSEQLYSVIQTQVKTVLEKEKTGHDDAMQLAFDTWVDYLQRGQLKNELRECIAMIRVLNMVNPKLILQYNFTGDAYPYKMWSMSHRVKTICIQHGFQGKFESFVKYDIESDVYLAWANLPIDMKRNEAARVEVVGNPGYVSSNVFEPSFPNVRAKILIAPTGLPHMKADADWEFWNIIIGFLTPNISKFDVAVKFHHKDRFKELVTEKLNRLVPHIRFTRDPIQKASSGSDIIVTTASTVALDTFFLAKPVIIINNAKEAEFFTAFNACPVLYSLQELEIEIFRLTNDIDYFRMRIQNQRKMAVRFEGKEYSDKVVNILLHYLNKN